jgi:hypothetical protein
MVVGRRAPLGMRAMGGGKEERGGEERRDADEEGCRSRCSSQPSTREEQG